MHQKLKIVMVVGVIAIAGGITLAIRDLPVATATTVASATAPQVPVATVLSRTISPSVEFTGSLAALNTVELRSRVGGTIDSVTVPEGYLVNKGQSLFQIDPRPFQVALDTATAQLHKDEVLANQAQADVNRAQQLVTTGAISRKAYDDAVSERNARQAQVHASKAAVAAARLDLSYAHITAPISGRVDRIRITEGNLVSGGTTGTATLLTTIVSLDPIHVYFDIDEATYLHLIKQADPDIETTTYTLPVAVGLSNDQGFPYQGKLDFISNQLDRSTGTIRARASVANPNGHLVPGLFARAKLTTGEPRLATLINDQAVGTDQGKNYVLVVDNDNQTHYRPIELGPMIDGLRVIESGLHSGERIIIKGLVRPGMTVAPRMVSMHTLEEETATSEVSENQEAGQSISPDASVGDSQ